MSLEVQESLLETILSAALLFVGRGVWVGGLGLGFKLQGLGFGGMLGWMFLLLVLMAFQRLIDIV